MPNRIKSTTPHPTYVTVPTFAKKKNVTKQAVRYHIYKGSIEVIIIDDIYFIDMNKHGDFQFDPESFNRRTAK